MALTKIKSSNILDGSIASEDLGVGVGGAASITDNGNATAITIDSSNNVALTGHLNLGDNDKIKLGAGDDLQIYHDGSHSYIKDTGTGNLRIDAASFQIRSDIGENMAGFAKDGSVDLFYNGSNKLSTTSTGIDVTGNMALATSDGYAYLSNVGVGNAGIYVRGIGASNILRSHSTGAFTWEITGSEKSRLTSTGLGLGTTAPSQKLHVVGKMRITDDIQLYQTNSRLDYDGGSSSGALRFWSTSGNVERMRVTSAGLLGVGTLDPKRIIHAKGDGTNNSGVLTEHYNGGRNYKNFYHTMTSGSTLLYHHVKTNISPTSSIMYRFDINGYNYGTVAPLEMIATGYAYGGTNTTAMSNTTIAGTGSCHTYLSSDNYICLRVYVGTSAYYAGFHVSGWFQNPTGYNHVLTTSSNTWTSSSSNQY